MKHQNYCMREINMHTNFAGKLVRDKIPQIIQANGLTPIIEVLSDEDYLIELDKKLNEEVAEYQESKSIEELADILEVILAICTARGYLHFNLENKRGQKEVVWRNYQREPWMKWLPEQIWKA